MIKYGLISETDARTLEKTIDLIISEFSEDINDLRITEIGLFDCGTARGIVDYLPDNWLYTYTGIDNEKDKRINVPPWIEFIKGDSTEVYNRLEDNSQHLIFVDGDHSLIGVISDFFAYATKVKIGGYFCFHDTGAHIAPFKDFQHGDKSNPYAYISVRSALGKIGMFQDAGYDLLPGGFVSQRYLGNHGFRLIFDEADPNDEAGGITVFKKIF